MEGAAHGNQGITVPRIGIPSNQAILEYLNDFACLVDKHLDNVVADFHLDRRWQWWRCRRLDFACRHVIVDLIDGALQRANTIFGKLQQRVIIGLQSDN